MLLRARVTAPTCRFFLWQQDYSIKPDVLVLFLGKIFTETSGAFLAPVILPFPQLLAAEPAAPRRLVLVHMALEAGKGSEAAPADRALKRAGFSRHGSPLLRFPSGFVTLPAGC